MKKYWLNIVFVFSSLIGLSQKAEIVFLVDMSASSNGIVTNLQTTIWSVVNNMDSKETFEDVKFGFVATGRKSYGEENHFTKVISDLESDINTLAYALLKTQVNVPGCDAYFSVGLDRVLNEISWSSQETTTKTVFIIGNGGIQSKEIREQIKEAKKSNIKICLVYFKNLQNFAEEKSWRNFAKSQKLEFKVADNTKGNAKFIKEYDSEFLEMAGPKLLKTYIPYGTEGKKFYKKLKFNFDKIQKLGSTQYEEMLVYQSSYHVQKQYSNWDLVDLSMKEKVNYDKIDREYLPSFLKGFSSQQLAAYVAIKVKERKLMVSKIQLELDKRNKFKERKLQKSKHHAGGGGLDNIIQTFINELYSS